MSECVPVFAVWGGPQGQLNAVVELILFSSLDVSGSDEVASAVATCVQAMRQLRKLTIYGINPLPLLRALGDRDCPLEHVTVDRPPWVCTIPMCVLTGLMIQCVSVRSW